MKSFFFIILLFICSFTFGQTFVMDDSLKVIYKPTTSSTPPHEYFQFENLSGDTIYVRWKLVSLLSFYPPEWSFALQDNETYHNPMIDSNDIAIPYPAGTYDKIIINVFHNEEAGEGMLVFDLINLDSTDEVHRIVFDITIYKPLGLSEFSTDVQIHIYPNPSNDYIRINELPLEMKLRGIFDIYGKKVISTETHLSDEKIDVRALPSGVYFILLESAEYGMISKRFIKQ